jgi:hypothetical protein
LSNVSTSRAAPLRGAIRSGGVYHPARLGAAGLPVSGLDSSRRKRYGSAQGF